MFFLGRRDFLCADFFSQSWRFIYAFALCTGFILLALGTSSPSGCCHTTVRFLGFPFFFIDFCTGMWGSSLRMVSFRSYRALSRSAITGVTSCMLCWGVWYFKGIMYAFRRFRIPSPFWVFLRMTGMKFSPSPVWRNCSHNAGFEM